MDHPVYYFFLSIMKDIYLGSIVSPFLYFHTSIFSMALEIFFFKIYFWYLTSDLYLKDYFVCFYAFTKSVYFFFRFIKLTMPSSDLSILEHLVEVALELYSLQNKSTDFIFSLFESDLAYLIYKYYQVRFCSFIFYVFI